MVGDDYTGNGGGVNSAQSGQPLLGIKWQYYDGKEWKEDDDKLTVTGNHYCNITAV